MSWECPNIVPVVRKHEKASQPIHRPNRSHAQKPDGLGEAGGEAGLGWRTRRFVLLGEEPGGGGSPVGSCTVVTTTSIWPLLLLVPVLPYGGALLLLGLPCGDFAPPVFFPLLGLACGESPRVVVVGSGSSLPMAEKNQNRKGATVPLVRGKLTRLTVFFAYQGKNHNDDGIFFFLSSEYIG